MFATKGLQMLRGVATSTPAGTLIQNKLMLGSFVNKNRSFRAQVGMNQLPFFSTLNPLMNQSVISARLFSALV